MLKPPLLRTHYRFLNRALRILLATNGVILVAGAMLGPIYALHIERIGGDVLDASVSVALFALTAAIMTIVSGRLTDTWKEKELIVVAGYLVLCVGFLLYLFADSVLALFGIQIVLGIGEALYSPAFDSLFSDHSPAKQSGRSWSMWEAMNYLSVALGAFIGGVIATTLGFPVLFVAISMMCLASALYIFWLPRRVL